jgi:hypothetical protein
MSRILSLAAVALTGGLGLLATACGGSPGSRVVQLGSTTAGRSSASNVPAASEQVNGAVAFSSCMRAHGVSKFPDPDRSGALPKLALQQLGVSSARFGSAQASCRHLFPNGGTPTEQAMEQVRALSLKFSRCVRAHGVMGFPDPGSDGRIPDPASAGIDQGSPKFEAANRACRKFRPPYLPSNAAYNSWARTHGS